MSISTISNNIKQLLKDIADTTYKISLESKKEAEANSKIAQITNSITKSTSPSTLQIKYAEIVRKQKEIAGYQSKKAELGRKEADLNSRLFNQRQMLTKAESEERKKQASTDERERKRLSELAKKQAVNAEKERKRIADLEKKQQQQQLEHQKKLKREVDAIARTTQRITDVTVNPPITPHQDSVQYDLFISHASEDKEDFVQPLAETLVNLGVKVWYDKFTLRVGDSLRRSIDNGLRNSRYGTIVLSANFIKKEWTNYELDGLVAREMNGHKMILPIWHKISKSEVMDFSPNLADKVALNTSMSTIEEIAHELADLILSK